ncbi:hypothetical protein PsorP6_002140 [Peronosclerospora sorghi]|uniref:Uncharacterized protein n=1 Tax=Peronosclerospora sorghi TaxID=230839 RepID=A0ACC0WR68_9STRA|nr:hypothetical protein PsorP6_002140 [Peronosclerospora sorghi]
MSNVLHIRVQEDLPRSCIHTQAQGIPEILDHAFVSMIFFGHLFRQNDLGLTEKIDAMNDELADLWWVVTRWICRRVVLSIGQHERNTAKSTRKDSNIEHAFSISSGAIRVKDDVKEQTHVSNFTWFTHIQSSIQRRRVMVGPDTLLLNLSIWLMQSRTHQDLKSASTS